MLFGKILLTATAVTAVAVASPLVFCVGRIVGRNDSRKLDNSAPKISFMHASEATKWSKPAEPEVA